MTREETRNYYTTRNYDHSTFGGEFNSFDFEGHHTMASMAAKIESDFRFDKQCKLNVINRDKNKNYKKEGK